MNPQTQGTIATIAGFVAGILASKFGIFDTNTWLSIVMAGVGLVSVVWTAVATRKNAVVSSVAQLPEVKSITLDANASGTAALQAATPANVKV